jgi:hypothetical protein
MKILVNIFHHPTQFSEIKGKGIFCLCCPDDIFLKQALHLSTFSPYITR